MVWHKPAADPSLVLSAYIYFCVMNTLWLLLLLLLMQGLLLVLLLLLLLQQPLLLLQPLTRNLSIPPVRVPHVRTCPSACCEHNMATTAAAASFEEARLPPPPPQSSCCYLVLLLLLLLLPLLLLLLPPTRKPSIPPVSVPSVRSYDSCATLPIKGEAATTAHVAPAQLQLCTTSSPHSSLYCSAQFKGSAQDSHCVWRHIITAVC
jgi:hypothetical protein